MQINWKLWSLKLKTLKSVQWTIDSESIGDCSLTVFLCPFEPVESKCYKPTIFVHLLIIFDSHTILTLWMWANEQNCAWLPKIRIELKRATKKRKQRTAVEDTQLNEYSNKCKKTRQCNMLNADRSSISTPCIVWCFSPFSHCLSVRSYLFKATTNKESYTNNSSFHHIHLSYRTIQLSAIDIILIPANT